MKFVIEEINNVPTPIIVYCVELDQHDKDRITRQSNYQFIGGFHAIILKYKVDEREFSKCVYHWDVLNYLPLDKVSTILNKMKTDFLSRPYLSPITKKYFSCIISFMLDYYSVFYDNPIQIDKYPYFNKNMYTMLSAFNKLNHSDDLTMCSPS